MHRSPARIGPAHGRHRVSRVVAAMSGGVDSSVAAALLAGQEGVDEEVIGVWMRTHGDLPEGYELSRSCCSPDAADDARRVAQLLGIPFFILNVEREFGARVIDAFVDSYLDGATPNPCQACNQYIKFDELLRRGLAAYGADAVATGHYARLEHRDGRWRLLRAADADKDQTYFLWVLDQDQLARTRFPLGDLTKPEVRRMAAELTLPTAEKPESQEICFVPDGDYREYLRGRDPAAFRPGSIVDRTGRTIGHHTGVAGFTIGQRKGLGLASSRPLYVVDLDADEDRVTVGDAADLERDQLEVSRVNFIGGETPAGPLRVSAKIRHNHEPAPATVRALGAARAEVVFDMPQRAITPGQSCVWYRGDEVVGGGVIERHGR
jgi:tRNA-uridine 2-sulfurtransferase